MIEKWVLDCTVSIPEVGKLFYVLIDCQGSEPELVVMERDKEELHLKEARHGYGFMGGFEDFVAWRYMSEDEIQMFKDEPTPLNQMSAENLMSGNI